MDSSIGLYTWRYAANVFVINVVDGLAALLRQLTDARLTSSREPEFLVHEAAQGHLDIVRDIVQRHPGKACSRYME